jgi:hypothetical protein
MTSASKRNRVHCMKRLALKSLYLARHYDETADYIADD